MTVGVDSDEDILLAGQLLGLVLRMEDTERTRSCPRLEDPCVLIPSVAGLADTPSPVT